MPARPQDHPRQHWSPAGAWADTAAAAAVGAAAHEMSLFRPGTSAGLFRPFDFQRVGLSLLLLRSAIAVQDRRYMFLGCHRIIPIAEMVRSRKPGPSACLGLRRFPARPVRAKSGYDPGCR
jgi:hypothetical protein